MKIIEKLSEQMDEELHDADMYIECAMKHKESDVLLSKMYADLSAAETQHALIIHENTVRIINDYKAKGNEVPPDMKAVYDYLHNKQIEKLNEIKLKQAMYKG